MTDRDVRVSSELDVRLIPRAEWDAAGMVVITCPRPLSLDNLDRIAEQAMRLTGGRKVVVVEDGVSLAIRGLGSDADASDAQ